MPRMFKDYQTQQKYFLIDLNRFTDKDLEDNDCIVSDFFLIYQMEYIKNYDNFRRVISRTVKNLKNCSKSLYDKFLNAVNTDLKSNHILKEGEDITSLEGALEMESERLINFRNSFKEELRDEVRNEVRDEVRSEVRDEVRNEVRDEVRNEIRDEVRNEVRDEVRNEVRDEVRNEVSNELYKQFNDSYKDFLSILIMQKFNVIPDFLNKTLSKIQDYNLISEICHSINNFDNTESLNSFIQKRLSHVS